LGRVSKTLRLALILERSDGHGAPRGRFGRGDPRRSGGDDPNQTWLENPEVTCVFLFFSIAMFESQGVGGVVGHGWRYVLLVASYFSRVSL